MKHGGTGGNDLDIGLIANTSKESQRVKFAQSPLGGNFSEIAQNFYLMIKLVCILGLGWISCNMGVLGAMFWTLVL